MSDLKPTPARIALLQAVADGAVTAHRSPNSLARDWVTWSQIDFVGAGWTRELIRARVGRVTGRMKEMEAAGWVWLGPGRGPSFFTPRLWEITCDGKKVLEVE